MFIMQQMTNIQTIHNRLKWKALQTDIPIVLMLKLKRMDFYIPTAINIRPRMENGEQKSIWQNDMTLATR